MEVLEGGVARRVSRGRPGTRRRSRTTSRSKTRRSNVRRTRSFTRRTRSKPVKRRVIRRKSQSKRSSRRPVKRTSRTSKSPVRRPTIADKQMRLFTVRVILGIISSVSTDPTAVFTIQGYSLKKYDEKIAESIGFIRERVLDGDVFPDNATIEKEFDEYARIWKEATETEEGLKMVRFKFDPAYVNQIRRKVTNS